MSEDQRSIESAAIYQWGCREALEDCKGWREQAEDQQEAAERGRRGEAVGAVKSMVRQEKRTATSVWCSLLGGRVE
eukprot:761232-Hanusia_phi.AAC.2